MDSFLFLLTNEGKGDDHNDVSSLIVNVRLMNCF